MTIIATRGQHLPHDSVATWLVLRNWKSRATHRSKNSHLSHQDVRMLMKSTCKQPTSAPLVRFCEAVITHRLLG